MRASSWNFGVCILLNFCSSIMEIKTKIRTSFKSLVSRKARAWQVKINLRVTIKCYKKQCLPAIEAFI